MPYVCSEPVQYILGEWDFEHIELKMRPPVFIPRAETEVCSHVLICLCGEKKHRVTVALIKYTCDCEPL